MTAVGADEQARLAALSALQVPEGKSLPALDELCEIASACFGVPIAFVSFIEERVQRMIAGDMAGQRVPRDQTVCTYTMQAAEVMVIEDLLADPRFVDNPNIIADDLRFYAGAPLMLDSGHALGTMCMLDRRPRSFSPEERLMLGRFAQVAVGLLREHALGVLDEVQREQLRESERVLARQNRVLLQTERLAWLGGWEMRDDGSGVTWSDGLYRIADISAGAPVALDTILAFFGPRDGDVFQESMRSLAREGTAFDLTLEGRTASGITRWVRITGERDASEEPAKLFGVVRDVTLEREQQAQLWHMANHDGLTGLPNRGYFNHRLEATLREAERAGRPVGLLFLDLDHFKDINDTLGHKAGDVFLVEVARRIERSLRPTDMVARFGGDEFAVALSPIDRPDTAQRVAGRLLAALAEPYPELEGRIAASASIGVALSPAHGRSSQELMRNADLALYAAKHAGRNACRVAEGV